jgi:DNA-binding PadR family transcriptional regulator
MPPQTNNCNPTRLSSTEQKILSMIVDLGGSYGLQLCRAADVKRGTMYLLLGRLVASGFLWSRRELPPVGEIGPSRRMYYATREGVLALKAWEAACEVWR